jgi:hypothetical protein
MRVGNLVAVAERAGRRVIDQSAQRLQTPVPDGHPYRVVRVVGETISEELSCQHVGVLCWRQLV